MRDFMTPKRLKRSAAASTVLALSAMGVAAASPSQPAIELSGGEPAAIAIPASDGSTTDGSTTDGSSGTTDGSTDGSTTDGSSGTTDGSTSAVAPAVDTPDSPVSPASVESPASPASVESPASAASVDSPASADSPDA